MRSVPKRSAITRAEIHSSSPNWCSSLRWMSPRPQAETRSILESRCQGVCAKPSRAGSRAFRLRHSGFSRPTPSTDASSASQSSLGAHSPDRGAACCIAPALEGQLRREVDSRPRSYRFNHVLLRNALYEGIEPAERNALHRRGVALDPAPCRRAGKNDLRTAGPRAPRLFAIEAGVIDPFLIGLLEEAVSALGEEYALLQDARVGAQKFVAQTQYDYARLLLRRGRPGDRDKVEALLTDAVETATRLELRRLHDKLIELQHEQLRDSLGTS